jgi:hypothetical protein
MCNTVCRYDKAEIHVREMYTPQVPNSVLEGGSRTFHHADDVDGADS